MGRYAAERVAILLIIALALAGGWVSGTLLKEHGGGWQAENRGTAFLLQLCESAVLPGVNCANVVGSRWGSFDFYVGGRRILIPTSLLGLSYFAALAIWFAMLGRIDGTQHAIWRLTLLALSGGLAGSIFFTFLMAFTLTEWCSLCVIAHGLNASVFVITLWLWRHAKKTACSSDAEAEATRTPAVAVLRRRLACSAGVAAGMAAVGFWVVFDTASETRRQWHKVYGLGQAFAALQSDRQFVLREYYAQPILDVPLRTGSADGESEEYSATTPELVIFTDYDCRGCTCFESQRAALIDAAFGGRIRTEIRHFPRELVARQTATADVPDDHATEMPFANLAAEAARLQGGDKVFARMHDLLLKRRKEYPKRSYEEMALLAGLDLDRFLADTGGQAVRQSILEDVALGIRLNVTDIPAAFLNGRRVPDLCLQSATFWRAIAEDFASQRAVDASHRRPPGRKTTRRWRA